MKRELIQHYMAARRHQMATYHNSGLFIGGVDQRQFVGGPAAYGYHAIAAYEDARRSIHFREEARSWLKSHGSK